MVRTLLDKIWDSHLVRDECEYAPAVIYIDLHLINEVTSPQAFRKIITLGVDVHNPSANLAMIDHSTPTLPQGPDGKRPYISADAENQVQQLEQNARVKNIRFLGWDSPQRGIVHVVGPELGLTLPGMTIVCGDSHTSTHGAFGALAFGIGTSEVTHVLATQSLLQRRPKTMRINIQGKLGFGVTAKDVALFIVTKLGASGATGFVIEYAGPIVAGLTMEERMTLCNMSIECGARAGLIEPDEKTFNWLRSCPERPDDIEARINKWRELKSDKGAKFDHELWFDVSKLEPQITWGITPDTAISVLGRIPDQQDDNGFASTLDYMGVASGQTLIGTPVDYVFIGSCTNARLSDLRLAAAMLKNRSIAPEVTLLVVPGSEAVRLAAEKEGLDRIFISAGGQWRIAGCSMCLGMNGDLVPSGKRVVSTSNRNFKGRQGVGARTILASPATAAASALAGSIADPRDYI